MVEPNATPERAAIPPQQPRCGRMREGVQCARPKGHVGRHIWKGGRSEYEHGVYDESERHRRHSEGHTDA